MEEPICQKRGCAGENVVYGKSSRVTEPLFCHIFFTYVTVYPKAKVVRYANNIKARMCFNYEMGKIGSND